MTILNPAFIPTGIAQSGPGRPETEHGTPISLVALEAQAKIEKAIRSGRLTAEDVAEKVLQGIRDRALYVFTHPKIRAGIEARGCAEVLERPAYDDRCSTETGQISR